jgi:hypothetical protein
LSYLTATREHDLQFLKNFYSGSVSATREPVSASNLHYSVAPFFDDTFSFSQTMGMNVRDGDHNLASIPQKRLGAAASFRSAASYSANPNNMLSSQPLAPTAISYCDEVTGYPPVRASCRIPSSPVVQPTSTSCTIRTSVDNKPSDSSARVLTSNDPDRAVAMLCKWEGCEYDGFFGREDDLLRHVRSVHVSRSSYLCPARECSKSFNRKDNRDAHFRRLHESSEINTVKKDRSKGRRTRESRSSHSLTGQLRNKPNNLNIVRLAG